MVCLFILVGCQPSSSTVISLSADAKVEQYDLYVRDDASSLIVFHSDFTAVQGAGEESHDLTKDALKISIKVSSGHYTLLVVGVIGDVVGGKPAPGATQLFWAGRVHVDGTVKVAARLLTVPPGDDADGDLWPDATNFIADVPAAATFYKNHPDLLDCDDKIDPPIGSAGSFAFKAADINPFAVEICGAGVDQDCDGKIATTCIDKDKDHDPAADCDDNDPTRHHPTDIDPFPDPPNCCGYSLGKKGTADENKDFTGDASLCPRKRCGDGIDESCRGALNDPQNDTTCVIDADCDGYPAPPQGNDCDDFDPAVHPTAIEACGSTKDLNCDGIVNGGCVPCDLDGDGFERNDPANGCPDKSDKNPGHVDCNDYDSAVSPIATAATGGTEAGGTQYQMLTSARRGLCRRVYEPTAESQTGTAKISSLGWLVGDADCNGQAYQGCPSIDCDADGDGFMNGNPNCVPSDGKFDCDDTNPTIYPGAPVSCSIGGAVELAEDCSNTPKKACSIDTDKDGDGWPSNLDCDDFDPNIHPWAVELCDGKDNDCDGFVDEGNPDTSGKPMVSADQVIGCTDSNLGECANPQGACVCSVTTPASTVDPQGRRLACPTELSGAGKPPRCFGAGQPHPQSCDAMNPKDDDCDGRVDAPVGKNLAVLGASCGTDLLQTRAGVVIGCDMTTDNCFEKCGRLPMSASWLVCSSDAICPSAGQCE